jgi:glyoxylate/hydroxypyruvate reductase
MAILLLSTVGPMEPWLRALREALPGEDVRGWPDGGDLSEIDIVLVAQPPEGAFARLPNLALAMSLRAGIDDLLADPGLGPDVVIARTQEPEGNKMFDETVLLHVLRHHKYMPDFIAAQPRHEWINPGVKRAEERTVGFLGLGLIALSGARLCRDIGFKVAAWTRTARDEPGIESFHGDGAFEAFMARSEIIVNLLPVTSATTEILNARAFAMLPNGACVINLGRGEHLVDRDLIAALDSGHLHSATLDVFRIEPLPSEHPFWDHPRITVMPHTSRRPRAAEITPQAIENIRRWRAGRPLMQQVDRARGY